MKGLIVPASLLILATVVLLNSCQKKSDTIVEASPSLEDAITEAKAWFANGPVLKEKELLKLSYSILPQKAPQRVFARMGKLQHKLIWNDAQLFNRNGIQYIIVPIVQNKKLRSIEYEMERAFVFYKSKDSKMNMNVVEVMSKRGESLNGRLKEIIATAFYNGITRKNEIIPGINATIFFYNEVYMSLNSYEIKAGVWNEVKARLDIRKDLEGLKGNSSLTVTEALVCETYHLVHTIHIDGVLVYTHILYTFQDCYDNGSSNTDPQTEDPNGSGAATVEPPLILNNVTDSCLYNSVEYAISRDCTNKIANFINTTFSTNQTNHLRFYDYSFVGTPLANVDAHTVTGPNANFTETFTNITLNTSQLSGASREYIAATIIHEAVHAWINYTYPNSVDNATQHNLMASTSRFQMLRSAILEMYPALSFQDATDLTWGGMYSTVLYSTLTPAERFRIEQRNLDFKLRRNNTGTPC